MTPSLIEASPDTTPDVLGRALADLEAGAARLVNLPLERRIQLAAACAAGVIEVARDWVEAACQAKRLPVGNPARAEEIAAGPVAALRYLRLIIQTFDDIRRHGRPILPGPIQTVNGQLRVPVLPTRSLFDRLLFSPLRAETWLAPSVDRDHIFGEQLANLVGKATGGPQVTLVLGAGNVSSIPITDALTKIFQENCAVLLKMNPVNSYLGVYFEQACQPLIQAGFLRVVYGGANVGGSLVQDPRIDNVHITGAADTHDRIVWGSDVDEQRRRKAAHQPVLEKPVTSELGNVSPWIVVPGEYSDSQLRFQAENVAASITNNASFNCVATKVLVTWKRWPARDRFLDMVEGVLNGVPPRYAYYPGALERFNRFSGRRLEAAAITELPWTLLRDADPEASPHCFQEESFVSVCVETAIDAPSEAEFLRRAVDFVNERLWGTLAAALSVPDAMRKPGNPQLEYALRMLRFGTIGVNQWPGVAYALMSIPWGGFPGAGLDDVQSGIGAVHNTYLLEKPEKTILRSPATMFPKPLWFPTHRCPEAVAWKLFDLYSRPTIWRLPALLGAAVRG